MNIKQELTNQLKKQLEIEVKARDIYSDFVKKINDEEMNKTIAKIIDDEIEHIEIVKDLMQTVENYKKSVEEKSEKEGLKKEKTAKEIFGESNTLILLASVEEYMHKIILALKQLIKENKIIYISYNKIPTYTKKIFNEHEINLDKILFINCVGGGSKEDINVSPEDLTKLSITVRAAAKKLKSAVVIVDTISGFSAYHQANIINQFVASMNNNARGDDYNILWVAIDEPSEKALNSKLSQLCDKVIKT